MSDKLEQERLEILKEEFSILYSVASRLSVVSGKVETPETLALLRAILNDRNNPGISDQLNKLLMLAKLTHSDHINEFLKVLDDKARYRVKLADDEERARRRARERQRNLAEASHALDQLNGIGPDNKITPVWPIKDQLLILMDRIAQDSCYTIEPDEVVLVDTLRSVFGVHIEQKGWITKRWEFTDTSAAAQARHLIASGKTS